MNNRKIYSSYDGFINREQYFEVDNSSNVVTSSSSASSLESSVSMKNKNDQHLSSLKNKTEIYKNSENDSFQQRHKTNNTVLPNTGVLPRGSFDHSTLALNPTMKMTTSTIESSFVRVPSRKVGYNDRNDGDKGESINTNVSSVVKNISSSGEQVRFYSHRQQSYPQGMMVPIKADFYAKAKPELDCGREPQIYPSQANSNSNAPSLTTNANFRVLQTGFQAKPNMIKEDKSAYSISGHLAQTILSSPQNLSMNTTNIHQKIPNPPALKIAAPAMKTVNSLPKHTVLSNTVHANKKNNSSVMFTPMALNNLTTTASNQSVRNYNRRRSNSDSFTTIKSHKRALTNSKSNGASNPNHHAISGANTAPLRRGKWTVEEEEYVARVIRDFNSGYLNAPAGTTLRTYLSEKLHCDPMRITKKFTGDACIGKRVFHPALRCASNADEIDKSQNELAALENRWRRRLEMQQREVSKKSIASIPAPIHHHGRLPTTQVPNFSHYLVPPRQHLSHDNENVSLASARIPQAQAELTQTALWLDRSSTILSSTSTSTNVDIEIKEVEKLINEVPSIKSTLASIPGVTRTRNLNKGVSTNNNNVANSLPSRLPVSYGNALNSTTVSHANNGIGNPHDVGLNIKSQGTVYRNINNHASNYEQNDLPHHDSKKQKRSFSVDNFLPVNVKSSSSVARKNTPPVTSTSGEEDAEALVRFFNSVRQESYNASSHLQNEKKRDMIK